MTNDQEKSLLTTVKEAIRRRTDTSKPFSKDDLLRDLLKDREEPLGRDAGFYVAFAHLGLRDLISRAVRETYYSVMRDGAQLYLPISDIGDAELLAIAAEYDSQAAGHTTHADEIRAYVDERRRMAPARKLPILVR